MQKSIKLKILNVILAIIFVFVNICCVFIISGCENIQPPPIIDDTNDDKNEDETDNKIDKINYNQPYTTYLNLSKQGGIYEESFKLYVSPETYSNKVYFTTDGSEPSVDSEFFPKDGLLLSDITNVASYPIGEKVLGSQGVGNYKMLHGICLKLLEIDSNDTIVGTKTATYVITSKYDMFTTMPCVFLTVNENEFITKEWDKSLYNITPTYGGLVKERPQIWGNIEYYNQEKNQSFNYSTKIKASGSGSLTSSFRTLNLNFNKDENGYKNDPVNADIFNGALKEDGTDKLGKITRLRLHSGGSVFDRAGISSAFVESLADKTNASKAEFATCNAFINGEYWGMYYIREHISDTFIADNFSVDKDNVINVDNGWEGRNKTSVTIDGVKYKTYGYTIGDAEDEAFAWKSINELFDLLNAQNGSEGDFVNDKAYQKFCDLVDIDSFIDCALTQSYMGNWDFGENNVRLWRTAKKEDGNKYGDTKWRFILHDTDYCFEPTFNTNRRVSGSDSFGTFNEIDRWCGLTGSMTFSHVLLLSKPMRNASFRAKLLERAIYLTDKYSSSAQNCIDAILTENFKTGYTNLYTRWPRISNLATMTKNMQNKVNLAISQGDPMSDNFFVTTIQNTIARFKNKNGL